MIADHIRACAFLICDGVIPGNEGRGYVLRRIARRAMRHGYKLGQKKPFFYRLVAVLAKEMGEAYPELVAAESRITATLKQEEERFGETLEHGMSILDAALAKNPKRLDGDTAFKLNDTFGFPVDLTADIGRERGFEIDMAGFDAAMTAQQERSRAASKFKAGAQLDYKGAKTRFDGYDTLSEEGRVVALYREGSPVTALAAGEEGVVVLDRTPFYAESGGQVGDRGELTKGGACLTLFDVQDTQKIQADVFGHYGLVKTGEVAVGDTVAAQVDLDKRRRTMRHHSVTHLMHKALREVLGDHVQQKGSLVDEDKTRFDFSHDAPMTAERDRAHRSDRERRSPRQCGDRRARDADRGCAEVGRDDAVRREVRRRSPRAGHRHVAGIVRRHACRAHRRHRPFPGRLRRRRGGRRAARRGGGGYGGGRPRAPRSRAARAGRRRAQGAAAGTRSKLGQMLDNVKVAGKGSRAAQGRSSPSASWTRCSTWA